MAKAPKPFEYRGGWRASVTLSNGTRPTHDFPEGEYQDAVLWMAEQVVNANVAHEPQLGGPTRATLAKAMQLYAELYTVTKGGAKSELTRINHYLEGGGLDTLKLVKKDGGSLELVPYVRRPAPIAWQQHTDERREARAKTYERIAALAKKRCSAISTADIRRLMACMQSEGLSESTIQKEIALLKHLFNVAAKEWAWKGFENPCVGIKLGKSQSRFVFLSTQERECLWQALEECDSSYYYPMVQLALETTLRIGSLLQMRWDKVDLEGRVAQVPSKTGEQIVALSRTGVEILNTLPRDASGRVFPMSYNAVDCAWDGVRKKAGLPTLQFKDLRHVGATDYARRGLNSHQLKEILGHTTTRMADVYINLVKQDVLDAMDRTEHLSRPMPLPPVSTGTATEMANKKRADRLNGKGTERCDESTDISVSGVEVVGDGNPLPEKATGGSVNDHVVALNTTNVVHVKFGRRVA